MRYIKVELTLSKDEQVRLREAFLIFLKLLHRQGARADDLEALLAILRKSVHGPGGSDPIIGALYSRARGLLSKVTPDQLTLAEAAEQYHVKADRLRRACWAHKLKGVKRGKTWFVEAAELEQYLHEHAP
jgi:hypothetical protein